MSSFTLKKKENNLWIPDITYLEDSRRTNYPSIRLPQKGYTEPPDAFVIVVEKETSEKYFDDELGVEMPVTSLDWKEYCDLSVLQKIMDANAFDKLRVKLGLKPLQTARAEGMELSNKIAEHVEESREILKETIKNK